MAEIGEQFPPYASSRIFPGNGPGSRTDRFRVHEAVKRPRIGVQSNHIAVLQFADQTSSGCFGRKVDRRRHLARGAGHSAVGNQRHLEAAALQ